MGHDPLSGSKLHVYIILEEWVKTIIVLQKWNIIQIELALQYGLAHSTKTCIIKQLSSIISIKCVSAYMLLRSQDALFG